MIQLPDRPLSNLSMRGVALALAAVAGLFAANALVLGQAESQEARPAGGRGGDGVQMPAYDDAGHLRLPPNYREWIFVGSSLGLSYTEGTPSHEMFHETLMEPGAYRAFVETGEFPNGTQLVLILHGTGEGVLPGRRGRFAAEVHGVEMAVKDFDRFEEGWAYYGFGGMSGVRDTAEAFPKAACHDCHAEHAALDNVFAQFYPMLTEAAGVEVALRHVGDESDTGAAGVAAPIAAAAAAGSAIAMSEAVETPHADGAPDASAEGRGAEAATETGRDSTTDEAQASETPTVLAYAGLDPVMLVMGREEMGKAEIVEVHEGWTYQFASEPNRKAFAEEPERYAPQNETCPVFPGAHVDPRFFAVHDGKIYTFASASCVDTFEDDPEAYVDSSEEVSASVAEMKRTNL